MAPGSARNAASPADWFRAGATPGRRRRPIALTPLIDVVFILLVFFMLASSMSDWRRLELNLGRTGPPINEPAPVLVEVLRDRIRIDGRTTQATELDAHAAVLPRGIETPVVLRPAAGVPFERAMAVLDALAQAGFRRVSLLDGRPVPGGKDSPRQDVASDAL